MVSNLNENTNDAHEAAIGAAAIDHGVCGHGLRINGPNGTFQSGPSTVLTVHYLYDHRPPALRDSIAWEKMLCGLIIQ